jgi:hypothetical protein
VTQWIQNKIRGADPKWPKEKKYSYYGTNGTVPVPECFEELNIFLVGCKFLLDLGSFSGIQKRNIFDEVNLFLWFICKSGKKFKKKVRYCPDLGLAQKV